MFMNVITGYLSKYKFIEGYMFGSSPYQGEAKLTKYVYYHIPYISHKWII